MFSLSLSLSLSCIWFVYFCLLLLFLLIWKYSTWRIICSHNLLTHLVHIAVFIWISTGMQPNSMIYQCAHMIKSSHIFKFSSLCNKNLRWKILNLYVSTIKASIILFHTGAGPGFVGNGGGGRCDLLRLWVWLVNISFKSTPVIYKKFWIYCMLNVPS